MFNKFNIPLYLLLFNVILLSDVYGQSISEIDINLSLQELYLTSEHDTLMTFPISSSKYGIGNTANSNKTPLGKHQIHSKFGENAELGAIFKGRINTGEIVEIILEERSNGNDFVTSRIMWLEGLDEGLNRGAGIDSYSRYIYIHGTDEEGLIGQKASHGCIRMKNADVIELFEHVEVGTIVNIHE